MNKTQQNTLLSFPLRPKDMEVFIANAQISATTYFNLQLHIVRAYAIIVIVLIVIIMP